MAFHQKQSQRNILWLLAGMCGISLLAWLTNSYAPALWAQCTFFLLLFLTATMLALFILNNLRRALLVSCGITGFFFLRLIGLREPLYPILLTACLVSLELYLNKR